ncbi:MAG: DUF429 domain-containing protein [Bacteroidetes bacterium]|nr:MAG: DUF429 domain-containing protein [Bacteroidota bacterium]
MSVGIGVDGCRGGWLIVQFDGQQAHTQLVPAIAELRSSCPLDTAVWIDMPIGLLGKDTEGRPCDRLARRILSPLRHSSVFTPPCRAAVYAPKEEASLVNYQHTGKKLSRQSLNILPKIRELDLYLQAQNTSEQNRWHEAHPEVVFAAFNGLRPLRHSKKTTLGQTQRSLLLKPYFSNISLWFTATRASFPAASVATDDLYDALALAIGSYLTQGARAEWVSLPEAPPLDDTGLPMKIVYAQV